MRIRKKCSRGIGFAPGAAAAERIYLHGNRVDGIVCHYNYAHTRWRYHHYDARGHCILVTDPSGALVEQYEYDAFGRPYFYNASNGWASDTGSSAFGNRFLFTGREWLSDLKLYDYRNRMYQPELGRFLQPDPKEFEAGDYNLYRYCHNDPVNKTDPDGLRELPDAFIGPLQEGDLHMPPEYFRQLAIAVEGGNPGIQTPEINPLDVAVGGLAAMGCGAASGVAAATGKEAVTQIVSSGSKQAALSAVRTANLPRALLSAVQRASGNVVVSRTGGTTVVTATRMGANGAQTMITVVRQDGTKTVVQIGVNKAMKIDHVHFKR